LLAAGILLKLPRFCELFSLCPAALRTRIATLGGAFSARLQPPFSHIRTPVEMNVLMSQPKSSQNGKVDATGYGNIISNYDPATFCSLKNFRRRPAWGG
jgi:hypothetical protein